MSVAVYDDTYTLLMATPRAPSEMIEKVREAIFILLDGGVVQAYTMPGGRNIQHYSLAELQSIDKYYTGLRSSEEAGGGFTFAGFNRPL